MSTLAITASLIAFAANCVTTVAPGSLLTFATGESGRNPLAIHDNADARAYHPATKAEAIAIATRLIGAGHSVDAGFMQVNSRNFGWLGLSVTNAFELCPSMQAGARVLHTGYDPCMDAGGEAQACLRRAASLYNTGSPDRGFANGYVRLIAATAQHVIPEIRAAGDKAPAPHSPVIARPPRHPVEAFAPEDDDQPNREEGKP